MNYEMERVFRDVTLDDLALIRHFVRDTAVSRDCDPEATAEFIVAVNEAAANIVKHGYREQPGNIAVTITCDGDVIVAILRDNAPGFDPTKVPDPDTTLPLAERPFGGLGIHLMRTYCDELRYRRDPRGGNELTLLMKMK
jgi:serine/threonine-protein kinase RsbW